MLIPEIFQSIFTNTCPKCHTGKVFTGSNPYNLATFDHMEKSCAHCGNVYEKEPGFFYGAMYVSYALMAGWFMVTWLFDYLFIQSELFHFILFISITVFFFGPLTFRVSRLLWMNFFTRFDKNVSRISN
jgi:hypothetical protein